MRGVSTTDTLGTDTQPARARLDRPVLVANIVSGGLWLVLLAFVSPPLTLVGAAYVAIGSVFLAAVYAREALSRRQEALAWAVPWFVAVALWTWIGAAIEGGASGLLLALWFGLVIATPCCYLAWQLALAVRQLLAWRARPVSTHR